MVVLGAREGRHHKEGGAIRAHLSNKPVDVIVDGLLGIVWQADDVPDLCNDSGIVPRTDESPVLLYNVLSLSGVAEVSWIQARHSDEDTAATGA